MELIKSKYKELKYLIAATARWEVIMTTTQGTENIEAGIAWKEFTDKFRQFGGDNVYAAWKLSYQEPAFRNHRFLGREKLIKKKFLLNYSRKSLCPNAEYLQPRLLQFKTNYWKINRAYKQANILKKTLEFFGR
jgi:perosamine synthetase